MTSGMRLRLVLAGLCLLGAAGCVSYPISKQLREQAQATKDVSFLAIWQNPNAYKGRTVIWGGKILGTVNEAQGGSIYVLQAPLDYMERPQSTKFSRGRFIARGSAFLDPEVYRTGEKITVAGELSGTETQNVGKVSYAYPVVTLREVHFWRPEPAVYVAPPLWGWGWYGPYYDGFYGDFYYPGYHPGFDHNRDQRYDRSPQEREEGGHERR
jgi:outer membrane lipoprotein